MITFKQFLDEAKSDMETLSASNFEDSMQQIKDALNNGDDYTAKKLVCGDAEQRKKMKALIKAMMHATNESLTEAKYTETGVQALYRKAFGAAANDKWWSKWNRADAAGKQAIWDHLTKKAEERKSVSENLNGSPSYLQIVKALPIGLAAQFKKYCKELESHGEDPDGDEQPYTDEQIDRKMIAWAKKNGAKFESLDEGMYVVKNKDGVEKRFKDHESPEAKAWKTSSKTAKFAVYSDAYWENKKDTSKYGDDVVTPWAKIDEDDPAIARIVKQQFGKNADDWHLSKQTSTKIDGTTCTVASLRVSLQYTKDDDLGLDGDVEDSQVIKIARDPKSPKTVKFHGYA
jgi:hypothetical protein